jgi:type II secretion system (T2SS) protein E
VLGRRDCSPRRTSARVTHLYDPDGRVEPRRHPSSLKVLAFRPIPSVMFDELQPTQASDEPSAYREAWSADQASPSLPEQRAVESPMRRPRPSLASLMAEEGIASKEQLEEALAEGQQTGERLGEVVLRRGWTTEAALANLIARQWDLTFVARSLIAVDHDAKGRLSREDAKELGVCPVSTSEGTELIALADPSEERLGAAREALNGSGTFVVTTPSALAQLIDELPESGVVSAQVTVYESPDLVPAPFPVVADTEDDAETEAQADQAPVEVEATRDATEFEPHADRAPVPSEFAVAAVAVGETEDDDSSPVLDQLDRLLEQLVSGRVRTSEELAGHRRRLDELTEERARVEESVRSLEDKLGQDDRQLESMRAKLADLT